MDEAHRLYRRDPQAMQNDEGRVGANVLGHEHAPDAVCSQSTFWRATRCARCREFGEKVVHLCGQLANLRHELRSLFDAL
jgi:hypothetical protein